MGHQRVRPGSPRAEIAGLVAKTSEVPMAAASRSSWSPALTRVIDYLEADRVVADYDADCVSAGRNAIERELPGRGAGVRSSNWSCIPAKQPMQLSPPAMYVAAAKNHPLRWHPGPRQRE